ncbi:MAG: outer membrane lipoprotein carrier protein LolA [Bacteroidota bacterium]
MKKLLFILPLFLLPLMKVQAQDTKAKAILDGVCAQTKTYTTIEIEFSYTMENKKKNMKETKKGTACMKGDKYWLSFAGQTLISDGKTTWTYIKESNEVQINNVNTGDDQSLNPSKLLTAYDKSFTPKFIKEEVRTGKTLQILDLTPLKSRSYYKIRVEIDKVQKQIANSIVYDKDGATTYTYSVSKFTTNKAIADTKFTFKTSDYPGVEVVDLR